MLFGIFFFVSLIWIASVAMLTFTLHKFVSTLLRQNPHYPNYSPPWVIVGFQSTRLLMPLSSNLTGHKQIFVAAETAASEAAACSRVWKFYQTSTVHLKCRMELNVNDLAVLLLSFCPLHCKNLNDLYCRSCQCQHVC